jgi:hypothetical protein
MSPLWWMSFTDPTLCDPTGNGQRGGRGFLGVIVTEADTLEDAITGTHLLGINPGGQIVILGPISTWAVPPQWRDRLLTMDEADSIPDPTAPDTSPRETRMTGQHPQT